MHSSKKKELSIKLPLLEHLNRTALSKDEIVLSLRLHTRCSQLLKFLYITAPSQQELDLLFSPLYVEFFNAEPTTSKNVNAEENNDNQAVDTQTKDHPLEQVSGNPSKLVKTRRQLATDPEMCMFALTVSTAEPKNIKEAMADSAWIEAMQEELH
ncbi:hypothetical protein Tco_1510682 [Tanacetum coccineum]